MKKSMCALLVACSILIAGFTMPAEAVDTNQSGGVSLNDLQCELLEPSTIVELDSKIMTRATGKFHINVPAYTTSTAKSQTFLLNANETVTFDCTYTPSSASVDFGLIAPDGYFYYENVTGGSINTAITVDERGNYSMAIRNNSSNTVSVIGEVSY